MKKYILPLCASMLLIVGCSDEKKTDEGDKKETMSSTDATKDKEERNKKVVMASIESFIKGDVDGVVKDVAPSFADYMDGSMPPVTNVDTLKSMMKTVMASIEGYKGENLTYYTDGDYVLVHGDWTGTFKNDLMGIKATGKTLKFKDVDIFNRIIHLGRIGFIAVRLVSHKPLYQLVPYTC